QQIHSNLTAETVQVNKTRSKGVSQKSHPIINKKSTVKNQMILDGDDDFRIDSDDDESTALADMVEEVSSDVETNSSPISNHASNKQISSMNKYLFNSSNDTVQKTSRRGRGRGRGQGVGGSTSRGDTTVNSSSRGRGGGSRRGGLKSGLREKDDTEDNDDCLNFDFRRKRRKIE
ncbi:unnamed protein product, partial [Trichobilharzia regenti]